MKPNLPLQPAPSASRPASQVALPRGGAYSLALMLTLTTVPHSTDLHNRITLPPITTTAQHSTSALSAVEERSFAPAGNWLEAIIDGLHSQTSEQVWATVPVTHASEIDHEVYG